MARGHRAHRARTPFFAPIAESTANLSTSAIVGQVRSAAVDLLRGLGEDREAAVATIRAAARDVARESP